jgi:hypothetical protein
MAGLSDSKATALRAFLAGRTKRPALLNLNVELFAPKSLVVLWTWPRGAKELATLGLGRGKTFSTDVPSIDIEFLRSLQPRSPLLFQHDPQAGVVALGG